MACTTVAHYYPRSRFGPSSVTGLCWSVTSSPAVYFQHRLSPQKLRRGKPVVGCGRSHRLFNTAPPEAWLTSVSCLTRRVRALRWASLLYFLNLLGFFGLLTGTEHLFHFQFVVSQRVI